MVDELHTMTACEACNGKKEVPFDPKNKASMVMVICTKCNGTGSRMCIK